MGLNKEEKNLAKIRETGALDREAATQAVESAFRAEDGPTESVVRAISAEKEEPGWMLDFRLNALDAFIEKPMPAWGPSLDEIDFEHLSYYVKPLVDDEDGKERTWDDVPEEMKKTYDRLGVPRAEAEALAGVSNQWDSEVVFHELKGRLAEKGVIFLDMDSGLREHEDLVREHFGTVIPARDNKFAALNSAFWSGGCLTRQARINTPEAIKSIADIEVGDGVYALNERGTLEEKSVLAKVNNGEKPAYEIHVAGRTLEATENHPFLILNRTERVVDPKTGRKWFLEWKQLKDVKENDLMALAVDLPGKGQPFKLPRYKPYISNRIPLPSPPRKTTQDLMWLMGIWLGDGSISWPGPGSQKRTTCHIHFSLPPGSKPEVRVEAKRLLFKIFGYRVPQGAKSSFPVNSKAIGQWMEDIGFHGNSHTKRIPEWVWGLPRNQKLALLGGLLDSNGFLERQGRTFKIELCNKSLVEDIQSLAISCGLYSNGRVVERTREASLLSGKNRYIHAGTSYSCRVTGATADIKSRNPKAVKILKQAKAEKRTIKKYVATTTQRFLSMTTEHLGFAPLKSKKYIGKKEVFDIQVDGLANFVANGIISHNSFVYAPEGVQIDEYLQTYFRINSKAMMQAERTLIIAEEGAKINYLEGCHPAGELVSVGDRMVSIESLQPGDAIINQNGNPSSVKKVMTRNFNGKMVTITPVSPENSFQLTSEHPVLTIKRDRLSSAKPGKPLRLPRVISERLTPGAAEFIPASEVEKGDFLLFPKIIPPLNQQLEEKFSDDMLTILGYYLAEGNPRKVDGRYKSVAFSFRTDEKELDDQLRACLKRELGFSGSINHYQDKHAAALQVYSDQLYDLCIKHCGQGSSTKQLSAELMSLSNQKISHLIDSYFKGDGNICYRHADTKTSKMIRVETVSRNLIFQIQELLGRQGIYGIICKREGDSGVILGRDIVRNDLFTLSYTSDAKFKIVRQDEEFFYVPVRDALAEDYQGPVFNIECDGPHSYLAKGFAVHNCSAMAYSAQDSLHAAVVELVAQPDSEINYFTAQNWDPENVWNMVTKRARAEARSTVRWIQGELGSRVNLKYPSVYLVGEGAHAEILSVAFAGKGQNQDTGGKAVHLASNTTSQIISKSISSDGGVASYRGLLEVAAGAENCTSRVVCDALILDDQSSSNTWPTIRIGNPSADVGHEATVSKVGDEQLFYLMSRGISEAEASALIVNGFVEPIIKKMPLEYAVEINRLIELQMEGSVG